MDFWEAKQIEIKNLKQASALHPHLFEAKTFIDSVDFLEKYGIFFGNKEKFPLGYLKLWPQDFIVEEISVNGELQNIYFEKFLHKRKGFLPEDPVLYATLVKCCLSTIEACEGLGKNLKISPQNIKYAGIKDKYAITSQLISIKGASADMLYEVANPYFFVKNIHSGNKNLYLGALRENQFTIFIRTGQDFRKDDFLKRIKEVEKNGFYNFFYLQRFGAPRMINAHCGLHVLKGDYEKAVFTAICRSGERESLYFQNIRKEIEKAWRNWEEIENILDFFPVIFKDEKLMINHLIQKPNDFIGALNQIPRVVQLWLTSLASLLFNKMLSFYIQQDKLPPKTLPLIFGPDNDSWLIYEKLLKQLEISSITHAFENIKIFPFILLKKRDVKTVESVKILNCKMLPEGVALSFILPKGSYATTFLSHLFSLVSGNLPQKFSNLQIDTKTNLGQPSLEEILDKFSDIISSSSWRLLWGMD